MEYQQLLEVGLAVAAGAGAGFLIKKFKKAPDAPEVPKTQEITRDITIDSSAVRSIVAHRGKSTVRLKMDETKLKSRMSGNRNLAPDGWEDVVEAVAPSKGNPNPEPKIVRTEKLKGEFSYKFFGSQLMIGDRIVVRSLPKKLHLLEITVQDQVFIDGVPQNLHVGDLEALKKVIRDAQLVK